MAEARQRITIAILALGGQGGGVLADWIVTLATRQGWFAQATSVPGVAQRTGSTIYYLELFPGLDRQIRPPVLALSPVPGDVDIVIASELMEAGRAILRGFVTQDRTTLIASTHRIYAISEKSAMGDGRTDSQRILQASEGRARQFIGFDMDAAADAAGCMISAVMFGALAQSGALPFGTSEFEDAIRAGGIAVKGNLCGFQAGVAGRASPLASGAPLKLLEPTTESGRNLLQRVTAELPAAAHLLAIEGVRRLMDYQDAAYSSLYLDRLKRLAALDADGELIAETARHLALWMSYEDTIRVADLKTRKTRFERVKDEVKPDATQVMAITEFMHPRFQEICDTMPMWLGRRLRTSKLAAKLLAPLFSRGRHVTTSSLSWFLILRALAGLRPWRLGTLRYHEETARIESWLALVETAARTDLQVALELVRCQRLVKGYGDTFARGLRNFNLIISAYGRMRMNCAAKVRVLCEAALKDENGTALQHELLKL